MSAWHPVSLRDLLVSASLGLYVLVFEVPMQDLYQLSCLPRAFLHSRLLIRTEMFPLVVCHSEGSLELLHHWRFPDALARLSGFTQETENILTTSSGHVYRDDVSYFWAVWLIRLNKTVCIEYISSDGVRHFEIESKDSLGAGPDCPPRGLTYC